MWHLQKSVAGGLAEVNGLANHLHFHLVEQKLQIREAPTHLQVKRRQTEPRSQQLVCTRHVRINHWGYPCSVASLTANANGNVSFQQVNYFLYPSILNLIPIKAIINMISIPLAALEFKVGNLVSSSSLIP